MIPLADDYRTAYDEFRWNVPERYNIAHDVCDRHARGSGDRTALVIDDAGSGETREWTFRRIHAFANRCANLFEAYGVGPGDRVSILLGQAVETAAANVACYKCGAVSVPLFTRFGLEDLEFRLNDAGAKVLVTDLDNFARVAAVRDRLPHLETVFTVDGGSGEGGGALDFRQEVERASDRYETRATRADDPAALLYTSGTTGSPKGVLHGHRVLLGHIPGMDFANDYLGQPGDRLWSPADWAWIGGLFDVLMPAWYHGLPVVAAPRADFDPEDAFAILARHRIRNTLLLPTMLKLMAQTPAAGRYETNLRSVFTGGEPVGDDVMAWAAETLGHVGQRDLRTDGVQPRGRGLFGAARAAAGGDRGADSGPRGGRGGRRRDARRPRRHRPHRRPPARSGGDALLLAPAGGGRGEDRERLAPDLGTSATRTATATCGSPAGRTTSS